MFDFFERRFNMKDKQKKISLTAYILILFLLAFSSVTILIICGRMEAKERIRLEGQIVQEQSQTL
ncbi:hypothetical protein D3C72_2215490 [compost metagenome]